MYCPHCGSDSAPGLKYCKRCGANLAAQSQEGGDYTPPVKLTSALWALALATVAICLGGLGIVISSAYDLARPIFSNEMRSGDPTPVAITMIVFGSVTVLGVIFMLIKLFARIAGITEPPRESSQKIKSVVSAPPVAQIAAPPAVMPSVTENTTRSFEQVYREPRERE
ncbi:MAG TPA: zinc ribbon domain-containing protein [Blastocatellia bacterium]|nr:zinc ribbon domain-containing protein [Blastocatellia bacterium]